MAPSDDDFFDDDLIDDTWDDDDPTIIEIEDEQYEDPVINEDDVVTYQWGGVQTTIQRAYFENDAGVTENSRSYTDISKGSIKFGYRAANSGNRTDKYSLTPVSTRVGSTTYYGIACNAERIKICQDQIRSDVKLVTQIGSSYGATGYLQVITAITISQEDGVSWYLEKLPFQNGLCVMER